VVKKAVDHGAAGSTDDVARPAPEGALRRVKRVPRVDFRDKPADMTAIVTVEEVAEVDDPARAVLEALVEQGVVTPPRVPKESVRLSRPMSASGGLSDIVIAQRG
jgi:hypothetical protein